jgi:hypothetical protein
LVEIGIDIKSAPAHSIPNISFSIQVAFRTQKAKCRTFMGDAWMILAADSWMKSV